MAYVNHRTKEIQFATIQFLPFIILAQLGLIWRHNILLIMHIRSCDVFCVQWWYFEVISDLLITDCLLEHFRCLIYTVFCRNSYCSYTIIIIKFYLTGNSHFYSCNYCNPFYDFMVYTFGMDLDLCTW